MPIITTAERVTAPVAISGTDINSVALTVNGPEGSNADPFVINDGTTGGIVKVRDAAGGGGLVIFGLGGWDANGGPFLQVADHAASPQAGTWLAQFQGGSGNVLVKQSGHLCLTTHVAPGSGDVLAGELEPWFDQTATAPKLACKCKDSAGTVFTDARPLRGGVTGALATTTFVSGTGKQIDTAADRELIVPVTFNSTAGAAATCVVALSPDNVTYSTLGTETEPVGVAFAGTIHLLRLLIPAAWYVRLTVANATIGPGTYY